MVKIYKQAGFTLLELMLVVAIIAAISVIGISAYKQQVQNFQVDKAALQMQQWMEAAVAYRVANGVWPSLPSPAPSGCTSINQMLEATAASNPCNAPTPVVTYVTPGSIDANPWGGAYELTAPSTSLANFQVSTKLSAGLANGENLAKNIAARLPNATTSIAGGTTPPYPAYAVTASVGIPSQGGTTPTGGTEVVYVNDQLTNGSFVAYPGPPPAPYSCPTGYSYSLHLGLNAFNSPQQSGAAVILNDIALGQTPGTGGWNISLTIEGSSNPLSYGTGTVLGIVTCDPPPTPLSNNNKTAANNNPAYTF